MLIKDSADIADSKGRTSFGDIIATFEICGMVEDLARDNTNKVDVDLFLVHLARI